MEIEYETAAIRNMARLSPESRRRVRRKIEAYAANPDAFRKARSLRGVGGLRLRVGDYRVIFELEGSTMIVLEVGHRRDIYD
jgi:mRNA interferase RelE/StbE